MSVIRKLRSLAVHCANGGIRDVRKSVRRNIGLYRVSRHGGNPFVYKDAGYPLVCHPDWEDSLQQFLYNAGDHWEVALARRWLESGDTVLDLGANTGFYTLGLAEAVGADGLVVSVDADALAVEKLNQSLKLTGIASVRAIHAAVSDKTGSISFFVRRDRKSGAEQSLIPSAETKDYCEEVTVKAVTVDDLVRLEGVRECLAMVKIDVEGAEADALKAVPNDLLGEAAPLWQVEIHPGALARFGRTPSEIVSFFRPECFELWLVLKHPYVEADRNPHLRRLLPDELFQDRLYYNLLAVPKGDRWNQRRARIKPLLRSAR